MIWLEAQVSSQRGYMAPTGDMLKPIEPSEWHVRTFIWQKIIKASRGELALTHPTRVLRKNTMSVDSPAH